MGACGLHSVNKHREEEEGEEEEEKEAQHAVVTLRTSNCCTWVELRSVNWRAEHTVSDVNIVFYSLRGREYDCKLQYMFCKGSNRRLKVYEILRNKS